MPNALPNPYRGTGLDLSVPMPRTDPAPVSDLLALCPAHAATPLVEARALAKEIGVAEIRVKDERTRMGLGSFKALGAAYAIATDARDARAPGTDWSRALTGRTYVTASAGNHGLSVAAGAAIFGAEAVIYLAESVPEAFASLLAAKGAQVVRSGATYEESMAAAESAASDRRWTLLSDSTWDGYLDPALAVMEGYLQLAAEAVEHLPDAPTHIFLQAGVGGMAAAVAAHARLRWGDGPEIIVVEPEAAPALQEAIRAGRLVTATGPVSAMGRLDCKTASLVALAGLSRDADRFVTVSETEVADALPRLAAHGLSTSPSGGAGLAALLADAVPTGPDARILAILSEGPVDA